MCLNYSFIFLKKGKLVYTKSWLEFPYPFIRVYSYIQNVIVYYWIMPMFQKGCIYYTFFMWPIGYLYWAEWMTSVWGKMTIVMSDCLPVSILPISFLYLFVAYLGVQNKVPHTQTKPLEHTACNSVPPAPTSQTTHLGSNTHQNPRTSCTHSPNLVDVYPSLYDISCQFVSKPYQNTSGICLPEIQSAKW